MSRILRRPMFRGGRVDGRGTGITSNLGYAGGGSVNTPRRGFVTGPGGYAGIPKYKTGAEIIEEVYAKPWLTTTHLSSNLPVRTTGTGEASGVNTTDKFIPNPERIIRGQVTGGGMKINPNYKRPTRTVERNVRGSKSTVQQPLTDEQIAFTTEGDHPGQAELWRDPGDTSGTGNGDGGAGTPEKTDAEKLAEYQKMFEEAYGTGRGDDISNMLLSFAGKALKPEATVKSSFGEFFEDEAKRPSERKKYKDAATTAAINAFLAGEKDLDSMMKQMALIDHKLKKTDEYATSKKTIDSLLSAYATSQKDDRTDPGVMQAAYNDLYKTQIFEGPLPENKDGKVNEDELIVGKIYYQDHPTDSRNKIIFIIQADGTPKQINTILK